MKAPAPETARDRVLTDDELRAFLRACKRLGDPFGPLLHLLLLTGQRRDEIAAAPRAEFDLDAAVWSLPATRTKNKRAHQLPLSTASGRRDPRLAGRVEAALPGAVHAAGARGRGAKEAPLGR